MCGIAGIYDPAGIDPDSIIAVSKVIRHRGPDDEGYLFVDLNDRTTSLRGEGTIRELAAMKQVNDYTGSVKLALIHRRLSIIDLSPSGHQPMMFPESDNAIVFNGEIYNYIELRKELLNLGYSFSSDSDTEIILVSYKHWAEKCVDHFIGMWAFVILDLPRNILFCSRDRFGIKPFYYLEKKEFFAFGSEIKSLLATGQIKPVLHKTNSIEFIVNGNQNFNGSTFFSGINELPPGHNLIYYLKDHKFSLKQYYKLTKSDILDKITHEEAVRKFSSLINDSINLHLRSDVPVGSCLSGGLDSSTIIAHLAGKNLPYKLSTFTAAFPGTDLDEKPFITSLSAQYDFKDYYTYPDFKKLLTVTDNFLWHQDLPVQSTSMFAQWEVMKLAHENKVKVLLDGQGMDEILGGYSEFTGAFLLGQLSAGHLIGFLKSVRDLRANYKTSSVPNELARALFYYLPEFLRYSFYSSKRIGPSVIKKDYKNIIDGIKFKRRISNSIRETSLMSMDNILPVLLRYEDRSSMAFSIESRVPYLDHRLVEFCINLPDDLKIHNGWTKYILRKSSEQYLPSNIIWRKEKLGFATPEKLWIDDLGNDIASYIRDQKIPDIINYDCLINKIRGGIKDRINLGEIWKIILFIKWYNVFNIKSD